MSEEEIHRITNNTNYRYWKEEVQRNLGKMGKLEGIDKIREIEKLVSAQVDVMRNGSFWTPFLGLLVESQRAEVGLWIERLISAKMEAKMENITMETKRDKQGPHRPVTV
ncbi:uncharacterized protein LOC136028428 [Artemia franciscana]|uniref:uncharacterized protein LOC136028428 n=1 Tax=Artemia franciscana TaxID=6661 RepID=UPI0032DAB268